MIGKERERERGIESEIIYAGKGRGCVEERGKEWKNG